MAVVVTNTGKAKAIDGIYGTSLTAPTYVDWGTGTNAASATDTALQTAGGESRTNGTKSKVTTTVTNDTYQLVGTITATGSKTITEAGIFDASSSGNMYLRGVFTGIVLASGDAIQFTVQIVAS